MATKAIIHKNRLLGFLRWTKRKERNYPWVIAVSIATIATGIVYWIDIELCVDTVVEALRASVILGSITSAFMGASLAVASGINPRFKKQLLRSGYIYDFRRYLKSGVFSGISLALVGIFGPFAVDIGIVRIVSIIWVATLTYSVTCLFRVCQIMFVIFVDPDTH